MFFRVIGDIKGENQWGLLGVVGFLESLGPKKVKIRRIFEFEKI